MFSVPLRTRSFGMLAISYDLRDLIFDVIKLKFLISKTRGYSSTSKSAGLGIAVGRDLLGKSNHVISVIGDGAMTVGQFYEAMNKAGFLDSNLIVVLNDNKQVSLPTATIDGPATPVGSLSSALNKLQASSKFRKLYKAAKVASLGELGGTRGLIPKPKARTLTMVIPQAIAEFKGRKVEYIANKTGIVHLPVGKADFLKDMLINFMAAVASYLHISTLGLCKNKYY